MTLRDLMYWDMRRAKLATERNKFQSEKTIGYRWDNIIRYFGEKTRVKSITNEKVQEYWDHRRCAEKAANQTIIREYHALMRGLEHAFREGHLKESPRRTWDLSWKRQKKKTDTTKKKGRYVSIDTRRDYISRLSPEHSEYMHVLATTGMRDAEARRLRYGHLSPTPHLHIPGVIRLDGASTKNGRPRTIPVEEGTWNLLLRLAVIPEPWLTKPDVRIFDWNVWKFKKERLRVSKEMGMSHTIVPRDMRHSYATDLIRNGVDPKTIISILGHSSLEMLNIYLHEDIALATSALKALAI